jgi:hypothetical protein
MGVVDRQQSHDAVPGGVDEPAFGGPLGVDPAVLPQHQRGQGQSGGGQQSGQSRHRGPPDWKPRAVPGLEVDGLAGGVLIDLIDGVVAHPGGPGPSRRGLGPRVGLRGLGLGEFGHHVSHRRSVPAAGTVRAFDTHPAEHLLGREQACRS